MSTILAVILLCISLLDEAGFTGLAVEVLSQFKIQLLLITLLIFLICIFLKKWIGVFVTLPAIVFFAYPVIQSAYISDKSTKMISTDISVLSFNLQSSQGTARQSINMIKSANADIVWLMEVNKNAHTYLAEALGNTYPYAVHEKSNTLFSKQPWKEFPATDQSGQHGDKIFTVNFDAVFDNLTFIGVHALSPKTEERLVVRDIHINRVSQRVLSRHTPASMAPLVIAGDFNSVPWATALRNLLDINNLKSSGLALSWPTWSIFPFQIPIDHILYNQSFCKVNLEKQKNTGSDHFPILARLTRC